MAVVPARGGSRGIKFKNLREVGGVSLVGRVGRVISEVDLIDRAVVSTDHEGIAAAAEDAGLLAPFRRPTELSGDRIGDLDVLRHALAETEHALQETYNVVVMLQPTSPLRRPEHVSSVIRKLVDECRDAVWTVTPCDLKYHPMKQLRISSDGDLGYYHRDGASIIARQQLEPLYYRNGSAYAFTRECLLEQGVILGRRSGAVVITETMISIDTEDDLLRAEAELQRRDASDGGGST